MTTSLRSSRWTPEVVHLYALNIPAHAIRAKVREEFDRNAAVTDIKAVDVLLLKGRQDLQETLNCWKMDSHILRWFSKEELPPRPDNFLDAFYNSRDDSKEVQPTA
ncbi:ndufa6 NADH-ubiquinone oxidoreductase subunit [Rhodotorula kratochvilovae]